MIQSVDDDGNSAVRLCLTSIFKKFLQFSRSRRITRPTRCDRRIALQKFEHNAAENRLDGGTERLICVEEVNEAVVSCHPPSFVGQADSELMQKPRFPDPWWPGDCHSVSCRENASNVTQRINSTHESAVVHRENFRNVAVVNSETQCLNYLTLGQRGAVGAGDARFVDQVSSRVSYVSVVVWPKPDSDLVGQDSE